MWLIANINVPRPDPLRKIISLAGAFILIIGVICWSPSQSGGDIEGLKNIVSRSSMPGFGTVSPSENSFQPGDAFFHDTGWTAIVFKYYFPDKPNYLIDGNPGPGTIKAMTEYDKNLVAEFSVLVAFPPSTIETTLAAEISR